MVSIDPGSEGSLICANTGGCLCSTCMNSHVYDVADQCACDSCVAIRGHLLRQAGYTGLINQDGFKHP